MEQDVEIREGVAADRAAIETLYPRSFPDEDLLPLVADLLRDPGVTISLVAVKAERVVGNIMFTRCGVKGHASRAALLAPLAVDPAYQSRGIGTELIRDGLRRLTEDGIEAVYVLGDPAYYGRLGFTREQSVMPPYPLPDAWADAWQSLRLGDRAGSLSGTLALPAFWLEPALWSE
jgi:putative acetyltransferase